MRGLYLCALCEAHKLRIIKLRHKFSYILVRTRPQIYNTCQEELSSRISCVLSFHNERIMSILRYFNPSSTLPTPSETGIGVTATVEANAAVQKE